LGGKNEDENVMIEKEREKEDEEERDEESAYIFVFFKVTFAADVRRTSSYCFFSLSKNGMLKNILRSSHELEKNHGSASLSTPKCYLSFANFKLIAAMM
jgi:hypothetical protein